MHQIRGDVADFAARRAGMAEVTAALGPVEILVNNAGITADTMFHKMSEARSLEARKILMSEQAEAANVAQEVAYGSPSQFSRGR